MNQRLFVHVLANGMPNQWLGIIEERAYQAWLHYDSRLVMTDVRGLILQPMDGGRRVALNVGSPYFGDTSQEEIAVDAIAVEILGNVSVDATGNDECDKDTKGLFRIYKDAVIRYRAARSGLEIPGGMEIPKNANITPLPRV